MANEDEKPTVARNLKALIGDESVNSWARKHGLTQTTINRIVTGKMDPTVGLLERIAAAVNEQGGHLEGWQLMVDGFDPRNPPILLAATPAERLLYERIAAFKQEVKQQAVEHSDDSPPSGGEKWLGNLTSPRRRSSDK
jgi:transcriptional regulator with XRE-family HTH domain